LSDFLCNIYSPFPSLKEIDNATDEDQEWGSRYLGKILRRSEKGSCRERCTIAEQNNTITAKDNIIASLQAQLNKA